MITNKIKAKDLIQPVFVKKGNKVKEAISSMPGVYKYSTDILLEETETLIKKGLRYILIFGVPENKDLEGKYAYEDGSVSAIAIREMKKKFKNLKIISDTCLCSYLKHGHCGIIGEKTKIDRRKTLNILGKIALTQARAGVDYVAPSAMVEGQVKTIRKVLDDNGYKGTKILGYSAKFVSNFYGPFRDVADSAPKFGDRSSYQLDYCDDRIALEKLKQDITEGANIIMVKPALGYLDLIKESKRRFNYPLAAYNVSGEYSLVKAGAALGYWDEKKIVFEIVNSIKRAGADLIITYHAKDLLRWMV